MTVTDEDLQKLGRPPIYSGKEDEWNEWSFVMKSYVSLLSTHVPALLTGAENPAASPDMSIATIRATLTEDGVTATKKLFHVLVGEFFFRGDFFFDFFFFFFLIFF